MATRNNMYPAEAEGSRDPSSMTSTVHSTGYEHQYEGYQAHGKSSPSLTQGKEQQSQVSSTGEDTGNNRRSDYKDPVKIQSPTEGYPVHKLPPTEVKGNQPDVSSAAGYNTGNDHRSRYKDPVKTPSPTEAGDPVHKPPSTQPTSAAPPPGPGNGHDKVSESKDGCVPPAPVKVNVNLHFGQHPAPAPAANQGIWRSLFSCCFRGQGNENSPIGRNNSN